MDKAQDNPKLKYIQTTIRVPEMEYRKLKSELALANQTLSDWMNKRIKEFINN